MKRSRDPVIRSFIAYRVIAFLVALSLIPAAVVHGQASPTLRQLLYWEDSKRSSALMELRFDPSHWTAGQVLSHKPYAVVSSVGGTSSELKYQLQIWRGTAVREGSALMTEWDVLGISEQGAVSQVLVNYARVNKTYFDAPSQKDFRNLAGAETYPWADLPTDAEAQARGIAPLPADGFIDVYGILPHDGSIVFSAASRQVKALPDIPALLTPEAPLPKALPNEPVAAIPSDLGGHWSEPYVLDLMGKTILKGFPDGTVQPNRKLSRAEFVAMLIRALQVEPLAPPAVVYSDVPANHWASKEIALAYEIGIIETDGTGQFLPSRSITRLEMARVLAAAMPSFTPRPVDGAAGLKDVSSLRESDQHAIRALANAGIVSGNDRGEFRPGDYLTRGEASKVLSQFLQVRQSA